MSKRLRLNKGSGTIYYVLGKYNEIVKCDIGEGTTIWSYNSLIRCKIGKNCNITSYIQINDGAEIGDNCNLQPYVLINSDVKIGNNVFIAGGVQFTDIKYPDIEKPVKKEPVIVGDNVIIGNGAILIAGIKVGDGAVIGAGTVVTRDVPPNSVWAGTPARHFYSRAKYDEKKRKHEDEV